MARAIAAAGGNPTTGLSNPGNGSECSWVSGLAASNRKNF